MKKVLSMMIIAIAAIFVSGCSVDKDSAQQLIDQSALLEEKEGEKEGGMLSGMMDEIEKIKGGESMKCVYTIKVGEEEIQSESYVQGEKFKSISTMGATEQMKTYAIFDGENQYSWVEGQTEGFKMGMDCADGFGEMTEEIDEMETDDSEDVMGMEDLFEDALNVDCQPVDNIDFTIPNDITFVDQCEMLKDQMKQLEDLGGALPEGFEIPMEEE